VVPERDPRPGDERHQQRLASLDARAGVELLCAIN
jgi:hypothetical protein